MVIDGEMVRFWRASSLAFTIEVTAVIEVGLRSPLIEVTCNLASLQHSVSVVSLCRV